VVLFPSLVKEGLGAVEESTSLNPLSSERGR